MRLFLAAFPPTTVQQAAYEMSEPLRHEKDGVSWVRSENLHFTLRFLGEMGEDGARRIGEAATEGAAKEHAFHARLGGIGAFPNLSRPRVLWVSMSEGAEALIRLARTLEAALKRRGFGAAERPFSPHLTLGRVRKSSPDWTERLAAVRYPDPTLGFTIDRVSVVKSTLSPKGSKYEVLVHAPLAGPEEMK
jgi:2'-5' RNA ligase